MANVLVPVVNIVNTLHKYKYTFRDGGDDQPVGFYLLLLGLSNVGGVDELHHEPLPDLRLPHQEHRFATNKIFCF